MPDDQESGEIRCARPGYASAHAHLAAHAVDADRLPHPDPRCRRRRVGGAQADRQQCAGRASCASAGCRRPISSTASGFAPSRSATSSSAIPPIPTSPRASRGCRCGSSGTAASKSIGSPRAACGSRARSSATRSAGARSTNCFRRRPASRSRLPNVVVDVADTTIALATPYGPLGFALQGRGNLAGGFKGKLAASAPRLAPGACRLDQLRAFVSIAVDARRPHVTGPVGAKRFACPASDLALAEPRMEIDSELLRSVRQLRRQGPADDRGARGGRQRPRRASTAT